MHQKPLGGGSAPPGPLAAVKGIGAPREGKGKGKGKGRRGGEIGGKGRGREGREG